MRRRSLLSVLLALLLIAGAVAAQQSVYQYTRISTNTTTAVKASRGVFLALVINAAGTATNRAIIYDSVAASGTIIAIVDTTVAPQTFYYNVQTRNGLTVVTTAGTPAELTVVSD